MKPKYMIFVLILLTVSVNIFIFYNSLQDSAASHAQSGKIEAIVEPIVEAIVGEETEFDVKWFVRKSAHLFEFAVLGLMSTLLVWVMNLFLNKDLFPYCFFYLLSIAVIDEYIQSFTGRTSSVSDVLIDFTGALIGLSVCRIVLYVLERKVKRLHGKKTTRKTVNRC